jgi:hypothetical protein
MFACAADVLMRFSVRRGHPAKADANVLHKHISSHLSRRNNIMLVDFESLHFINNAHHCAASALGRVKNRGLRNKSWLLSQCNYADVLYTYSDGIEHFVLINKTSSYGHECAVILRILHNLKSPTALTQKESHCVRGLDCALIYSVFNTNI